MILSEVCLQHVAVLMKNAISYRLLTFTNIGGNIEVCWYRGTIKNHKFNIKRLRKSSKKWFQTFNLISLFSFFSSAPSFQFADWASRIDTRSSRTMGRAWGARSRGRRRVLLLRKSARIQSSLSQVPSPYHRLHDCLLN